MIRWAIGISLTMVFAIVMSGYGTSKTQAKIIEPKKENPFVKQWVDNCAEKVAAQLDENDIPGAALAIVYKDQVYLRTFGVRSLNTRQPVDEHSVFRLASLSKTFAGVLTAKMVRDNKVRWNNRVVDYIPEFALKDPVQTDNVKVKHLLSHTTGLPYHTYTNLVEAGLPITDIIPQFKTVNLTGSEGSIYSYQNAVFSVIGEVLKTSTGKTYKKLLQDEILTPLRMDDVSTSQAAMLNGKNVALPHKAIKAGWHQTKVSKKYYNTVPAGGVNASIHDMATYMKLLLGHYPSLLSKEDLSPIFQPFIKTPVKKRYFKGWDKLDQAYYGMGWRVLSYDSRMISYHSGFVNSYKGELMIDHENDLGFCLLMNAPSSCAKKMVPICLNTFDAHQEAIFNWDPTKNP